MVTALAAQRPFWGPGTAHGYYGLTFRWFVGEAVRRVSGRSLGTFLAEEIAAPLGPSTNGICTARALARFYAALIGEVDGHPRSRRAGWGNRATGERHRPDPARPVRIGTGLGLPIPDTFWYSPGTFGFPGLGGSLRFADPAAGLAFGYVMNHITEGTSDPRVPALVDAVRAAMKGI